MAEIIELPKPPRMRGIKQAIEELRKADPETALTETALRRLILKGEIPHVRAGSKYLINLDTLCTYLATGTTGGQLAASGGIRRIAERRSPASARTAK